MRLAFPYEIKPSLHFGNIPTIKVVLDVDSPEGKKPFAFLFDTGADVSSMPVSIADRLGVNLAGCPQEPMTGYEGRVVKSYRSAISVFLGKKTILIPCVFSEAENVPILLGRAGILNRFTITLDGRKRQVVLKKLAS